MVQNLIGLTFENKKEYAEFPRHGSVDLRKYVPCVYNLNSCTANAVCAAYGLDLTKQKGYDYFDLSRLFLYYNTRKYEETTDEDCGASLRDTVKALNRYGVCKEAFWPYDEEKFMEEPTDYCYLDAKGNNLCEYERLPQDIQQFRACLKEKCPFVFGFNVYQSFHSIGEDGRMQMPDYEELLNEPEGRHAAVAVGYDDKRRHIIVLNSWGEEQGNGGYFFMSYDFIKGTNMCFDFWKISFACQKGKPRPKKATTTWGGSGGGYASGCSSGGACGSGGGATGRHYCRQQR